MGEDSDLQRVDRSHACRVLALVLATAAMLYGNGVRAEEAPAEPASAATKSGPYDDFDRGTPRGAVHGFLVACREGDHQRAANYLQLGSLQKSKRSRLGPLLARELKTVLDRELWVEENRLSDDPEGLQEDGLPPGRDLVGVIESKSGPVQILLDRVPRGDGVLIWKFASATVRQIPKLYDEFGYGRLGTLLPAIFFETQAFEIQLWQWSGLLIALFAAYLLSWLVARGFVALTRPVVARSASDIDDAILGVTIGPVRLLAGTAIFYLALSLLSLSVPAQRFFVNAMKVSALVSATWLILRLVDVLSGVVESGLKRRGETGSTALVPLGRKTVKTIVVGLTILASLDSFGFDVTAVIAGLGVGGLAVALAAQKTIENLFGGATLIADRPVEVGDFCRFGDKIGTVEDIGMRSTRVRTLDRTVITIPNSDFSSMQLENFGKRDKIKFSPKLGLLYATTPDQLRYVLVEIRKLLYSHPKVSDDPARVRFIGFGDSSLDVEIFAYVRATDYSEYLGITEDLNLRIMDIVAASGTGFAFPSTTTYLAKDEGTDPEKSRRAEEAVRGWVEREELYLPGFPAQAIESLAESIEYPPRGAPPDVRK